MLTSERIGTGPAATAKLAGGAAQAEPAAVAQPGAGADALSLSARPSTSGVPAGARVNFAAMVPVAENQAAAAAPVETTSAPAGESKSRSFLDVLLEILKAIIDLLLAPFRLLLGLFGVGRGGKASHAKLNEVEKANGRPVTATAAGAPDTGAFGPYPVEKYSIQIPTRNGGSTPADVYLPRGRGPFAPVIHSYGLASAKENHAGTARHYASWGLAVIVPKLPNGGGSPSANAPELSHWVAWLHSRPRELPPLKLDRGVALSGHSFGGLSSVLAGSTPGIGAVVALDPADAWGTGKAHAPALQVPSAFIVGERSLANQFGNGRDIYAAAGGDKQMIRVKGAGHSDFENASEDGAKNAANETAMRFATGFLLNQLTGRPEFAAYARGGAAAQADKAISLD